MGNAFDVDYSSGIKSPCMNCSERHAECHGRCKDYAQYVKANEEARSKRHKSSLAYSLWFTSAARKHR